MQGGTTYTFVTDGIESALELARSAAGNKDVGVWGGANIMRQYLKAGCWTRYSSTSSPYFSATASGFEDLDPEGGRTAEDELDRDTGSHPLRFEVVKLPRDPLLLAFEVHPRSSSRTAI